MANQLAQQWADPRSFATTLFVMYTDTFCFPEGKWDDAAYGWDPTCIQMEIEQTYGIDIPAVNFDRIITAIKLVTSNNFFVSLRDFIQDCIVLSGHELNENRMMLPDAAELAWGMTEGLLIWPAEEDNESPFNPEITGYIGAVLDQEGIINPPDILRIGTRDGDIMNRVTNDYSDDPELGASIWQFEHSKTDDINYVVKGRLTALLMQLHALPLATGKTEESVKKILKQLGHHDSLPMPL